MRGAYPQVSITASQRRPASKLSPSSLSRSPVICSTCGNSSGFDLPRLNSVSRCPRAIAASTSQRPKKRFPPIIKMSIDTLLI